MPSLRRTRRKLQKQAVRWTIWGGVFVIFLVGTFTGFSWWTGRSELSSQLPRVVARVNGEEISRATYEQFLAQAAQFMHPTVADWATVKEIAFGQLLETVVLKQEAQRRGLRVTQRDIDKHVNAMVATELDSARQRYQREKSFRDYIRKEFGSLDNYAAALRRQAQQQVNELQDALLQEKLRESVEQSVKVTEKDLRMAYTQFRIRHILVSFARFFPKGKAPTLQDQQTARRKARERAQQLRQRLLKGEDFQALARKESDDTPTASKGGDLGAMTLDMVRGRLGEAIAQALPRLKVGEISEPLEGWMGYHLLQVESKRVVLPPDYDKVRYRCENTKCAYQWLGEKGETQCPKCKGKAIKVVGTRRSELLRQLRMQRQQEAWDRLRTDLRQRAQVDIQDPELRGLWAARNGDAEEARRALGEALKIALRSPDARRHFLYPEVILLELARLEQGQGKLAEAERHLQEALKYSDDNSLHLQLGTVFMLRNKKDAALKEFMKVANSSPTPVQRQVLANYLEQLGRKDLAEQQRRLAQKEQAASGMTLPLNLQ